LSSIILMLGVMYIEPLQPIFKTVPLGTREWAITLVAAGIPTFLMGAGSVWSGSRKRRGFSGPRPLGTAKSTNIRA
ncbi:cation transporting ATPase C-terminal domain-containing protein, partial [Paenibacillus macerans]|nr:cation transporting ATPase C-terminal domain-containing protein [Paenibacillus macerans]